MKISYRLPVASFQQSRGTVTDRHFKKAELNKERHTPPLLARRMLLRILRDDLAEEVEGDLEEKFFETLKNKSSLRANVNYWWQVMNYLRPFALRKSKLKTLNSYDMFQSYFKIGWRNLVRSKSYSIINISGLAIGMAVAILIGLWVFDELNSNRSFENYKRIGMVYHNLVFGGDIITHDGMPYPYGKELKNNFAEFEEVVMTLGPREHVVGLDEKKFSKTALFVDPGFTEMFSLQMTQGSWNGLKEIRSVMLARSLAETLVGNNALGKSVRFDNRDELEVTGVFEDFPANSQFADVKMLVPIDYHFSLNEDTRRYLESWESFEAGCYVVLNEKATWPEAELKIKNFLFQKTTEVARSLKPEALLHPMEKWNLYGDFKDGRNAGGKIRFVWMFGTIGTFILILACINFMNLSTARSEKRSKEVGIRKVMGSVRNQLVNQFLSESILTVLLAFLMALVVVFLCLPWFNEMADKKIEIPWGDSYFIFASLAFILLTSLLAGSYPALYLSSFNPVKVLKGTFKAGRLAVVPRKMMVAFQFTISTSLIIGTIVVFQQIQYAKNRPAGFDLAGIIQLEIRTDDLANTDYNSLRHDLLATNAVENMAKSDFPITGAMSSEASITWQGKDPSTQPLIAMNRCSHDFPNTNGFQFIEGRDFSRDHTTDSMALIVNEKAAKLFSPTESALGKKIKWGEQERTIIGVIKDQIRWTPYVEQAPHMYYIGYEGIRNGHLTIRLKPNTSVQEALEKIEAVINKYDPGSPFEYKFQDDDYARLFQSEERIGRLATVFAALAIFISCIGIFGLASFAASQRIREIGIRKVLGATVFSVWKMLSRDFVLLVIISVAVAAPVAYYFSNQWLEQYDYRIEIAWWIFAITGLGTLAITLLTVSYQSIKAALSNPVNSLRSE